ncbi:hypothetical protein [Pseudomonas sp. 11/12A]|uniref:hypothetical protein n=1 Tax=Pseudomonas sp. 11/12A TaxID=1506582 RepID=UPI000648219C|nr:hypothetical protein [Pseudomonas sp. 11/12A]
MTIHRNTQVQRACGLGNSVLAAGLSFRAIGLLAYILSQPIGWSCTVADLIEFSSGSKRPEGRDSVYATIKELISAGYIVRRQLRDEEGQMDGVEHEAFALPQKGASV